VCNERRYAIREAVKETTAGKDLKKSWVFYYNDGFEESLVVMQKDVADKDIIRVIDDNYNNVYNESI
jgi:hypothetical protein